MITNDIILFYRPGDELITPVYTPPTRPEKSSPAPPIPPNGKHVELCDDEDDCLYNSSGDGIHDGKKHKGEHLVHGAHVEATWGLPGRSILLKMVFMLH